VDCAATTLPGNEVEESPRSISLPPAGVVSFVAVPVASPAPSSDMPAGETEAAALGRLESRCRNLDEESDFSLDPSDSAAGPCTCWGMKAQVASKKRLAGLNGAAHRRPGCHRRFGR
jgi:hypothetical protein